MVERQAERHLIPRENPVFIQNDRFPPDFSDSKDRRLWRVNDRRKRIDTKRAEVCDRECAAAQFGG